MARIRSGATAHRGIAPAVISSITKNGNFQTYSNASYQAFTGMWGTSVPLNESLVASSSLSVTPTLFPAGTVFNWSVTPDPDYSGVNGYLHLSHGNYDNSAGRIPSRQVNTISALSLDTDWTFAGTSAAGVLAECYLSAASTPAGDYAKTHEIAFFVHCPAGYVTYVTSLPAVGAGSFTSNGVTWNVVQGTSSNGNSPYLIAYRPDFADFTGVLPFKDYFDFLLKSGKITGNEWFNGVAIGAEPYSGTGTLTITRFVPTYIGGATPVGNLIVNGTFDAADAGWTGFWYSGKAPSNGKAVFTTSPAYDGINQPAAVTAGKYYEASFTISGYSAGSVAPMLTGGTQVLGRERSGNGTFTERLLAVTGNTQFFVQPRDSGATLSIDNVSVLGPYDVGTVNTAPSDTFSRPNSGTLSIADTGHAWGPVVGGGTWSIVNGTATGTTGAIYIPTGGLTDMDVSANVIYTGGAGSPGIVFNASDANNRLYMYLDTNGSWHLSKFDAGVFTDLASGGFGNGIGFDVTVGTNHTYNLRAVSKGNVISCYVGATKLVDYPLSAADATKFKTYTSAGLRSTTATGIAFDNFVVKTVP